jgi:hypothetical protein
MLPIVDIILDCGIDHGRLNMRVGVLKQSCLLLKFYKFRNENLTVGLNALWPRLKPKA